MTIFHTCLITDVLLCILLLGTGTCGERVGVVIFLAELEICGESVGGPGERRGGVTVVVRVDSAVTVVAATAPLRGKLVAAGVVVVVGMYRCCVVLLGLMLTGIVLY